MWNYALYKSIETYKETGKSLGQSALNAFLPQLKKAEETLWLSECYSQVLQATTLNLTTAYKNFFAGRARFPRHKPKHGKQSIQYPQNVRILDSAVQFPGKIGKIKANLQGEVTGTVKTVTINLDPSGKYFASILTETQGIRMLQTDGTAVSADGGKVRPKPGRKSVLRHSPAMSEAHSKSKRL